LPTLKAHHKYKLSAREQDARFVAAEFATFVSKSGVFVFEELLPFGGFLCELSMHVVNKHYLFIL